MRVVPAIDLRDGHCVQLRGGSYDDELVRLTGPLGVATWWRDLGFDALHVVDLDRATGRGDNLGSVRAICALEGVAVQAGGGVRDDDGVARLLDAGARSVIVSTRAVAEPAWLASIASAHPDRVSLAVDVRGGLVTTEGWQRQTSIDPVELVGSLGDLALHQVLATAVDVEGTARGPDLALVARLRAATDHALGVAGGVATTDDLRALRDHGVDTAVVGTALYTGALDPVGLNEELVT